MLLIVFIFNYNLFQKKINFFMNIRWAFILLSKLNFILDFFCFFLLIKQTVNITQIFLIKETFFENIFILSLVLLLICICSVVENFKIFYRKCFKFWFIFFLISNFFFFVLIFENLKKKITNLQYLSTFYYFFNFPYKIWLKLRLNFFFLLICWFIFLKKF